MKTPKRKGTYVIKNKCSSIYLRDKLSERELELLKKDLIDYSVLSALKIKYISFSKEQIESMVINSVERVLLTYEFGNGGSLGDLVKGQVMADLRVEFEKAYPDKVSKIIWPDLAEKKPFDRLLELLQTLRKQPEAIVEEIFDNVSETLNGRQQKLLSTVYSTPSVTYPQVRKQFGTRGVMTYREIKIVYTQLLNTIKFLEVEL